MNVKLLRKIQAHVKAVPQRFDMTIWGGDRFTPGEKRAYLSSDGRASVRDTVPECGTICCIGGWAETLTSSDNAVEVLRLSQPQASRLFYCGEWPAKFRRRYNNAKTQNTRVMAAIDRIDHFIKTKGRE